MESETTSPETTTNEGSYQDGSGEEQSVAFPPPPGTRTSRGADSPPPNSFESSAPPVVTGPGGDGGGQAGMMPPPPQPQPVAQDGASNTVVIPEGGSELNPDVTGEKANTPGATGAATDGQAPDHQPGYDADGNPLPGADGWVSMDDWLRLNDRDGDGQLDRNPVDLSADDEAGTGGQGSIPDAAATGQLDPLEPPVNRVPPYGNRENSGQSNGEAIGAPPGAVGDEIPVPSFDSDGVAIDPRVPGGPLAVENVNVAGPTERPGLSDLSGFRPGVTPGVSNVPFEEDGTAVPGRPYDGGPATSLPPGLGQRLDRDGDGRPDFGVPPGLANEPPGFTPPGRGPGLTIPEDIGVRQPGPEYEPGVDEAPPPTNGDAYPPGAPDMPPTNGDAYPPGTTPPRGQPGGPAPEPPVHAGGHGQGTPAGGRGNGAAPPSIVATTETLPDAEPATETTGESLDVFFAAPSEGEPQAETEPGSATVEPDPGGSLATPVPSSWEHLPGPTIVGLSADGQPVQDPMGNVAGVGSTSDGQDGISPELAAVVDGLEGTVAATAGAFSNPRDRQDSDSAGIIERAIEAVKDLLFVDNAVQEPEQVTFILDEASLVAVPPGAEDGGQGDAGGDG